MSFAHACAVSALSVSPEKRSIPIYAAPYLFFFQCFAGFGIFLAAVSWKKLTVLMFHQLLVAK